jgi:multiple sugar transport system permease protein
MKRNLSARILGFLLLSVILAWCLAPLLWQLLTSLKPDGEITARPASYWPRDVTLDHYASLFSRKPFGRYLWNSLFISSGATLLCLAVAAPAAYSLSRLRPRGAGGVIALLIGVSLFPAVTFFFPLYEIVRALHLANNPIALIVPYATFNLPLAVLFLAAFFRTIPPSIEEAGLIDGLGRLGLLLRVILPLSGPGLATTAILVFIASWNEFLFALTFMPRDEAKTVTVAIASLSGGSLYELPWGLIGAAIMLSVAPLVVMAALFQRRIVEGLTKGSVTG